MSQADHALNLLFLLKSGQGELRHGNTDHLWEYCSWLQATINDIHGTKGCNAATTSFVEHAVPV